MPLSDLRRDYAGRPLREEDAGLDPFALFDRWFRDAEEAEPDPTAMVLATATREGHPSARTVLLKGLDDRGFAFFTNYESRKARELDENPRASLLFFWRTLERQVRIDGMVERVSKGESDAYFATRPRESRISAHASRQSTIVGSRSVLEESYARASTSFADGDIPRPTWWGGFVVVPHAIEFWQGRLYRLHDRLLYTRQPNGGWSRNRLAP